MARSFRWIITTREIGVCKVSQNKKLLEGLRAGLIQQKKAAQESVRAIGVQLEAVEDEIDTVEIEALHDMTTGTLLTFDESVKYFIPTNPGFPPSLFAGVLLRDVKAGEMLTFHPRKNTKDVAVKGSAVGIVIADGRFEMGDPVYLSDHPSGSVKIANKSRS
jgi:hypothetical protein